mmetsp:Transcript_15917/g.37960  ORF Transcript_15917/g.37960 Transcript_15917/m.37960 type:complete len:216 (-) Transcript_15917:69-716(-)
MVSYLDARQVGHVGGDLDRPLLLGLIGEGMTQQLQGVGGGECVVGDGCRMGLVLSAVSHHAGCLGEFVHDPLHGGSAAAAGAREELVVDPSTPPDVAHNAPRQSFGMRDGVYELCGLLQSLPVLVCVAQCVPHDLELANGPPNAPRHQHLTQPVDVGGPVPIHPDASKCAKRFQRLPVGGQHPQHIGRVLCVHSVELQHFDRLAVGQPCPRALRR